MPIEPKATGAKIGVAESVAKATESRAPIDPAFDEQLYLALNPDVAEAVKSGIVASGLAHWQEHGRAEEAAGQRPSLLHDSFYPATPTTLGRPSAAEIAAFNPASYLAANPDVVAATGGSHDAAVRHWLEHGRGEARLGAPPPDYSARQPNAGRIAELPFGVNFYAPFASKSGLGTAARGYLAALRAAGIPVHLVNIDLGAGRFRVATRDLQARAPYRINLIQVNADLLRRFQSLFPSGQFSSGYTIAIWAWEMNSIRPDWVEPIGMLDEIWTLSRFNSDAVAPISPVPVVTMNCVVAPAPAVYDRGYFRLPDGFLFLTAFDVGSAMERKNPYAVVNAFQTMFAGRPDVHLVLKLHGAEADPQTLREFLHSIRGIPNVIVRSATLTDAETRSLQACCDCLVSAHRSEGFGLNIAEFMLLAKPVIVTGYSGNMDFTNPQNCYMLDYRLVQLKEAAGPYLPGYQWAEPDAGQLATFMRAVVQDPAQARHRAELGADTVRTRLSAPAIGQRIRARLTALGLHVDLPPYAQMMARRVFGRTPDYTAIAPLTSSEAVRGRPRLSVIVPVYDVPPEFLRSCIASVMAQTYTRWELCLVDDASTRADTREVLDRLKGSDPRVMVRRLERNVGISGASNEAVRMASGQYLVMLDNDDELTPDALQEIASAVIADPGIDALYSDEDKYDTSGKLCDHYFKPDWSPEHLESVMYTLHPLTVRTSLFLELGGFRETYSGAQDWDLMLRVSRRTQAIHHIPKILYHWRMIPGSASAKVDAKPRALAAGGQALADHVRAKYGDAARVEPSGLAGYYRVRHAIAPSPVTLLILTNNASVALPERRKFVMVQNLIQSIETHTDYADRRIVVVDNGNTPEKARAAYRRSGIQLHSYAGPVSPFNFAMKANFALQQVRTEHVVMMNDDMEAFEPDWLGALLEQSQRLEVGACGGKLLHSDGTIQHAGTVLGVNGGAAHMYHGFPGDFVGYNGYTHVVRNYSVITGACLATRMSVLNEVGGWDPSLAIDYNDLDLCLRMRRHGYRIVYTPFSRLYHFESKTSVRDARDPAETSLFMKRWRGVIENDPFYNPNLSRSRHDYAAA